MLNLLDPLPSEDGDYERRCDDDEHTEPLQWVDCPECGGEGTIDIMDAEPTDDDPEDEAVCPSCLGKKGHWVCPGCLVEEDETGPSDLEEEE